MLLNTLPRQVRRQFLGSPGDDHSPEPNRAQRADRFGRIFNLPSFAEPTVAVKAALLDIGRPGGMLDANDELSAGPVALIANPALSLNNPDSPLHAAGTTFVGQFLDHDMKFESGSQLDLDTVYGHGPVLSRHLYDQQDRGKLRIENGGVFEDVPRSADNTAILGDPRNDENLIISGLHAAFLFAHNRARDMVRQRGRSREDGDGFEEARRLLRWHYQWLLVHEFLPLFIGQPLVDEILRRGRRFYTPQRACMPVDFQGGTSRFGYIMVRPSYRANLAGDAGKPFFGFIFDPAQPGSPDPSDLVGGARAPRRFIGWQSLFRLRRRSARAHQAHRYAPVDAAVPPAARCASHPRLAHRDAAADTPQTPDVGVAVRTGNRARHARTGAVTKRSGRAGRLPAGLRAPHAALLPRCPPGSAKASSTWLICSPSPAWIPRAAPSSSTSQLAAAGGLDWRTDGWCCA